MELIEQKLKTLTSYHGVIVNVRLDEARLPDGSTAKREDVYKRQTLFCLKSWILSVMIRKKSARKSQTLR